MCAWPPNQLSCGAKLVYRTSTTPLYKPATRIGTTAIEKNSFLLNSLGQQTNIFSFLFHFEMLVWFSTATSLISMILGEMGFGISVCIVCLTTHPVIHSRC